MPTLFDPIRIGALDLPNRIIMSPLTRARAGAQRVPNQLMAEYYRQRAAAGLIISEATSVSPMGVGYYNTPGIWSEAQVAGWKLVTRAVHQAGGRIVLQLWHVGRISDPVFLDGKTPLPPSAIAPPGRVNLLRPPKAFVTPRAIELSEIPGIIEEYRVGAVNAKNAGFDGVHLHGANGYLPDQFLQDGSNHRTDRYGGGIENRTRFMFEALDAIIGVWGADRVGLHLAPRGDAHGMGDSNPAALFSAVAEGARARKLAFLCLREHLGEGRLGPMIKRIFGGPLVANEGLTFETASALLDAGEADAAAFGKLFIANPDLVERFTRNAPLNAPVPETFYADGERGYTDYPELGAA